MTKLNIQIWGREFELGIEYDCYENETILDTQTDAVNAFVNAEKAIEYSLEEVKQYCLKINQEDIGSGVIENIFKYVAPKYLFIPREADKRVVSLMCNYRFDQEHGIAIVFENEMFVKIGSQDIIL